MKTWVKLVTSAVFFNAVFVVCWYSVVYAEDKLSPIDLSNIKVGGEIGRRIDVTVNNNLLVLDADEDFLRPFKEKKISTEGLDLALYVGLGKLIDATVRFAIYTNNEQVIALKNHIVSEVIKAQLPDGYIGQMEPDKRMWTLWDVHEMFYLVYGLVSDYRYFGEKKSLDAARKTADYIIERWPDRPKGWPNDPDQVPAEIYLSFATLGIDEAFVALSEATGDNHYQNFCIEQMGLVDWDLDIVLGRHGEIEGHANAYMARCVAQMDLFRRQPDKKLLSRSQRVIEFLTNEDGLEINGACGYMECWQNTQQGFFALGETCATAYFIRLLDRMLRLNGDAQYGDLIERAIYNALFAAQSPDGRRIRYYVPLEGDSKYFEEDTYCCPNNFRRIIAELPTMIYYRSGSGLVINLYTTSTANVDLGGGLSVSVRQETDYPNSGKVVIHLNPSKPAKFPLRMRIPRWCTKPLNVLVNDSKVEMTVTSGGYLGIERLWKEGDRVEIEMPMEWRAVRGRKAQEGRFAMMRGPVVFCLNPDRKTNLKNIDLKLLRLDPTSPRGPGKDNSVRPNGMVCGVRAWDPHKFPDAFLNKAGIDLVLTEFADPGRKLTFFLTFNPYDDIFKDDELLHGE